MTEGTLRLADFLEAIPAEGWICCSCTFNAAALPLEQALQNLRDGYPDLLAKYPQLRLKLAKIGGLHYWKYATEEESAFDNLVEVVPSIDNTIPATYPPRHRSCVAPPSVRPQNHHRDPCVCKPRHL